MVGNPVTSLLLHLWLSFVKTLHMFIVQLKIHQSQPNIYTLFWRFDLITRSSSEEACL